MCAHLHIFFEIHPKIEFSQKLNGYTVDDVTHLTFPRSVYLLIVSHKNIDRIYYYFDYKNLLLVNTKE